MSETAQTDGSRSLSSAPLVSKYLGFSQIDAGITSQKSALVLCFSFVEH